MFGADLVVSLTNTSIGLAGATLIAQDWHAGWLILPPAAVLILAYRAYLSEHTKHQSLEFLYGVARSLTPRARRRDRARRPARAHARVLPRAARPRSSCSAPAASCRCAPRSTSAGVPRRCSRSTHELADGAARLSPRGARRRREPRVGAAGARRLSGRARARAARDRARPGRDAPRRRDAAGRPARRHGRRSPGRTCGCSRRSPAMPACRSSSTASSRRSAACASCRARSSARPTATRSPTSPTARCSCAAVHESLDRGRRHQHRALPRPRRLQAHQRPLRPRRGRRRPHRRRRADPPLRAADRPRRAAGRRRVRRAARGRRRAPRRGGRAPDRLAALRGRDDLRPAVLGPRLDRDRAPRAPAPASTPTTSCATPTSRCTARRRRARARCASSRRTCTRTR